MAVTEDWDPARYRAFRDLRLRPALDLLAQIREVPSGDVIDLGCGDGAVAPALAARFKPDHHLIGVDASARMLEEVRKLMTKVGNRLYGGLTQADIALWAPHRPPALIFSNAALNWVPGHEALMPKLAAMLAPGGVLAVQMPRQADAPSHRLLRDVAGRLFPDRVKAAPSPVMAAGDYVPMLLPFGEVRAWTTDYLQLLDPVSEGHPVRAFTESTAMRPVVQDLSSEERRAFIKAYDAELAIAYRPLADGRVLFPFTRVFFVLERS